MTTYLTLGQCAKQRRECAKQRRAAITMDRLPKARAVRLNLSRSRYLALTYVRNPCR